MKQAILFTISLLLSTLTYAQTDSAAAELPKFYDEGLFFKELPASLDEVNYTMKIIKNEFGETVFKIHSQSVLSEDDKRYAIDNSKVLHQEAFLKAIQNDTTKTKLYVRAQTISPESLKPGDKLLPFKSKDTAGKVWSDKNTVGKPLVLNFWYTGCGPCIKEMPELNKWIDSYPNVNYLAVTWDKPEQIAGIIKRRNFKFPQIANDNVLRKMFAIQVTPTFVLVDKQGVVRKIMLGTSRQKRDIMLSLISKMCEE